ncbi:TIGR02186 family protein [Sneathiella aquimaris]|uniref:TIGR02186 family protein n=1 Tax=Sneathiella aquimaris TaxID=2599305 RepID=UPI00146DF472|nr:TIGR02186 family protein [Sneathiella aquimaris]
MKHLSFLHSMLCLNLIVGFFCGTSLKTANADGSLVTDISSHLISVTSDFTGTDLLLFGTIRTDTQDLEDENGDIIIVVRGPEKEVVVRKKERVLGVWANTQSVKLAKIPSFYASASSRPVEEIASESTLARLRIGSQRLVFQSSSTKTETKEFRKAVIRQQQQAQLYIDSQSTVQFLGPSLFRTTIDFPANVSVGTYVAEFYLFRGGELVSAQSSPLFIEKVGLGRRIFDFAQNYPVLHGLAAILLALLAGWIASAVFRKD